MSSGESASVAEQTYVRLRAAVLQGTYPPGERLTSVRLAHELGVSRTPIRAALARLRNEGLVEYTEGQAAWVPPLTVSAVEEAYEIAEALESMLMGHLALLHDTETLRELEAVIHDMDRAAEANDHHAWAEADERFHTLVHSRSGRDLVASMLERVGTIIDRVRFLWLNLNPGGALESTQDHRAAVEAVAAGDGQLARERHAAHLRRIREQNVSFLRQSFPAMTGPPVADHRPTA